MPAKHPFRPHGSYDARVDGRILVTAVSGSWNIEMHRAAALQSAPLVAQLDAGGPWVCLVEVTDTLLSCLEVLHAGREAVSAGKGISNLKALAWVIAPEVEGNPFLIPRVRAIYDGVLANEIFATTEQATAWLRQRLDSPT